MEILRALGIDWRVLFFDISAFLIFAFLAERFIYPPLMRALDGKRRDLQDAKRLKTEAQEVLTKAREAGEQARRRAEALGEQRLAEARQESVEIVRAARSEALRVSERTLEDGKRRLAREAETVRGGLRVETAELVATAAARVIGEKLTAARDRALIEESLEEAL